MNALKHGNRSADAIAKQKEFNQNIRAYDLMMNSLEKRKTWEQTVALLVSLGELDNLGE